MDDKEELHLTSQELQVLSELDSRQFGFLKLRGTEHGRTRALVLKAVKYLEGMLVQVKEEERACSPGARREICIDPKTFCKLGHFHLLLEDYAKGQISQINHPMWCVMCSLSMVGGIFELIGKHAKILTFYDLGRYPYISGSGGPVIGTWDGFPVENCI